MGAIKKASISYLDNMHEVSFASNDIDIEAIEILLQKFGYLGKQLQHVMPTFFVLDYGKRKYHIITDTCEVISGYKQADFMECGMELLMEVYYKKDFTIYNNHIFSKNIQYLQQYSQKEHENLIFTYNFRIQNANKQLVSLLQKNAFITDISTGLPLYSIGTVADISHFTRDTTMLHTIEKKEIVNSKVEIELLEKNFFYPNQEDALLSKKEKEILKMLADGLCSKEIADKLHISEFTVINHRKSLLRKTNTKNVAEMVAFAIRSRIV